MVLDVYDPFFYIWMAVSWVFRIQKYPIFGEPKYAMRYLGSPLELSSWRHDETKRRRIASRAEPIAPHWQHMLCRRKRATRYLTASDSKNSNRQEIDGKSSAGCDMKGLECFATIPNLKFGTFWCLFGIIIPIDFHFFQRGGLNHQAVVDCRSFFYSGDLSSTSPASVSAGWGGAWPERRCRIAWASCILWSVSCQKCCELLWTTEPAAVERCP